MSRDEWIVRCTTRYRRRADLSAAQALEAAEACWENRDPEDEPEYAADEDMACWTDDGAGLDR